MADELAVNGGGADVDVEIAANEHDSDETTNQTIQKLTQKIQILEQEKKQLADDKDSAAERIKQLEDEILSSESDKRALSSIAARAAELEGEVSRLQHDLISSMSEGQESSAELTQLRRVVEEVKRSESEKAERVDVVEKERNLLLERLSEANEKLKESEDRIHQFEMRESDLKSEKLKVEAKINEKDEQIRNLNRTIEELQSVIVKNQADIEKSKKEKDELETGNNNLESLLKKSEARVSEMESKIDQLQSELDSYEKIKSVVKERDVELTNGIVVNGDEKTRSLKPDWPVIAATAGAVAIVAVVYFRHAKF